MNRLAGLLIVMCSGAIAWSAAVAEPVALRLGAPAPARAHLNVQIFGPWAQKVTAASEGTLKVEFVPGGVLGTEGQLIERVKNGVVDIAYDLPGYYPGRFVKTEVVALPLLFESSERASQALWRLFETGKVSDEFHGIKMLGIAAVPNSLFMSNEPMERIEDLAGKKIQASTKLRTDLTLLLAGVPVSIPVADTYQSLSKRTINIAVMPWTAVQPFRLGEIATNYLEAPLGGSVMMFFMNKEKFDGLPPQAKKAIESNASMVFSKQFGAFWDKVAREGRDSVAAMQGRRIRTPDEAELASWKKLLDPVRERWVKDTPNGANILKSFSDEYANADK
jgi:TRAP-type C4-dicarboxylate transport system substrate-binding protein